MSNDTVNFGKGKIVTDGLVLRLDANSPRSYTGDGNTYDWYDLSAGTTYNAVFKNGEDLIRASGVLGTATDPNVAFAGLNKSQGQLVLGDGSAKQSSNADLGVGGKIVKAHIAARGGQSKSNSSTAVFRH